MYTPRWLVQAARWRDGRIVPRVMWSNVCYPHVPGGTGVRAAKGTAGYRSTRRTIYRAAGQPGTEALAGQTRPAAGRPTRRSAGPWTP